MPRQTIFMSEDSETIHYNDVKSKIVPDSLILCKDDVRVLMRERRAQLDPRAARVKQASILARLQTMPAIQAANTLALYCSMPGEVVTDDIIRALRAQGKTIALPCVEGREIVFRAISSVETDLKETGVYRIREPVASRCPVVALERIDLFIVPGIAFDCLGTRVGFGGGYYDRVLRHKRRDAGILALAFDFQVVYAIHRESHDVQVHTIVTDRQVFSPCLSSSICKTEQDTMNLARTLARRGLSEGDILALHGDLGTGKTVFVKGLAGELRAGQDIISPTFLYCREYRGKIPLYHIDAYRVDAVSGMDSQFWDEMLEQPGIVAIEWAERLGPVIPRGAIHLVGRIVEQNVREWTLFTSLLDQVHLHGEPSSYC